MTENQQENKENLEKGTFKHKFEKFHDKNYKLLLLIPAILLVFSIVYISIFYSIHKDPFNKDISLTGGTTVTLSEQLDINKLKQDLSEKLEDIETRDIYDIITGEHKATIIETKSDGDYTKKVLEEYLGHTLDEKNSSFEFTGSTLSSAFYKQLLMAMFFGFVFMSIVVFLIYRSFIPSSAVIISAFADILMTLVVVDLVGIKVSSAGIIAFLLLIGYSVDTDILLTNRILKRTEGSINERIFGAFKTGITMTLTSICAVLISLTIIGSLSSVLNQIFTILSIGLFFDILNTWITNVSIMKWYAEKNPSIGSMN